MVGGPWDAVMETQIAPADPGGAVEAIECSMEGCCEAAIAQTERRRLCAAHFISVCTLEIESRGAGLKSQSTPDSATEGHDTLRNFLAMCVDEANRIAEIPEYAGQPVQEHLHEIARRASQLNSRLRRSSRVAASVPVWLRREDPRHTWEEETWTSTISRHGAGFACHHSVKVNGRVVLCRRDKGSRVQARVVYCRFDAEGRRQIGVELLDRDDFWGLEKDLPSAGTGSTQNVA